jgi:hypothetical protein
MHEIALEHVPGCALERGVNYKRASLFLVVSPAVATLVRHP